MAVKADRWIEKKAAEFDEKYPWYMPPHEVEATAVEVWKARQDRPAPYGYSYGDYDFDRAVQELLGVLVNSARDGFADFGVGSVWFDGTTMTLYTPEPDSKQVQIYPLTARFVPVSGLYCRHLFKMAHIFGALDVLQYVKTAQDKAMESFADAVEALKAVDSKIGAVLKAHTEKYGYPVREAALTRRWREDSQGQQIFIGYDVQTAISGEKVKTVKDMPNNAGFYHRR